MSSTLNVLHVFIASPDDMIPERHAIKEVADKLNQSFEIHAGQSLKILGWEDISPGYGRAQEVINADVDKSDIFIGFLGRKWGSSPGKGEYTSGFEEEYHRALERKEKTGSPEICIFFKEIDELTLSDAGPELNKILCFKNKLINSRKVLFDTFKDINCWNDKTHKLLLSHLVRSVTSKNHVLEQKHSQSPEKTNTTQLSDATTEKKNHATSKADKQITEFFGRGLELIKNGEMSSFSNNVSIDKLTVARLGLGALSLINRDIDDSLPSPHLINYLYKNKSEINLTHLEEYIIFKTNISCNESNSPGWYWLYKSKIDLKFLLRFLTGFEKDPTIIKAALEYALKLKIPLNRLLKNEKKSEQNILTPIDYIFSVGNSRVKKVYLEHLKESGTARDLAFLKKIKSQNNSDLKDEIDNASSAILLKTNPSNYFENNILSAAWVSEDSINLLKQTADKIAIILLKKGLRHTDGKVQTFSAIELARRGSISLDEISGLDDKSATTKVFEAYYLGLIKKGECKLNRKEVRSNLTGEYLPLFTFSAAIDVDDVLGQLFKLYSYDELINILNEHSKDSLVAYRILAELHFAKFSANLRQDIKTNFSEKRQYLSEIKKSKSLLSDLIIGSDSWSSEITEATSVALAGLVANGNSSDRDLVEPFLTNESIKLRTIAISFIARFGTYKDLDYLMSIIESENNTVADAAVKAILKLDSGKRHYILKLLQSKNYKHLKAALIYFAGYSRNEIWTFIESRLYDENEKIRELICAYAIQRIHKKQLEELLNNYMAATTYYYNVVFIFDRYLYGTKPFKNIFSNNFDLIMNNHCFVEDI